MSPQDFSVDDVNQEFKAFWLDCSEDGPGLNVLFFVLVALVAIRYSWRPLLARVKILYDTGRGGEATECLVLVFGCCTFLFDAAVDSMIWNSASLSKPSYFHTGLVIKALE